MRLFTAIEIPTEVGRALERLRGGVQSARWIDRDNYHLTLSFIGDVDARKAADIDAALADIIRTGFELRLDRVGVFGGDRPRALWAGVNREPALHDLQAEIAWALTRVGARPDGRKFTPHVTLARLKGADAGGVASWLSRHGDYRSPPFDVARFVLFSSRPSKGGGPYVIERVYPLATPWADYEFDDDYGADLEDGTAGSVVRAW